MGHDLVIVGGGLAGATLGACMARAGARVLILERSKQFHDRVRGEGIHPWGIPESLLFPIGGGRIRTYFATGRRAEQRALTGSDDLSDFAEYCVQTGVPRKWFDHARLVGPLATFEGADVWVEHPYKDGLVLIGDAAAANDPCWGCGLSLTLRDVRVLRDALLASDDWDAACNRYAVEHDHYYGALRTITSWLREVRYRVGPDGDRLREHALPRLADGTGPDLWGMGPDNPSDEASRIRFLGY